jgi:hypothetical protein
MSSWPSKHLLQSFLLISLVHWARPYLFSLWLKFNTSVWNMNEFTEVATATPLMKGIPCETKEGSSISVLFAVPKVVPCCWNCLLKLVECRKIQSCSRGGARRPEQARLACGFWWPGAGRVSSGARRQREYIYIPPVMNSAAATVKGIGF